MSITSLPATAEGTPKFEKGRHYARRLVALAWVPAGLCPVTDLPQHNLRNQLSFLPETGMAAAKKAQAAKVEEIRIAAIMDTPAGERIRALRDAIDRADYASFRYSSSQIKADLSRELQTVIAAATQGAGHHAALSAYPKGKRL